MSAQKGYCEDLTEGKFSFPISHALWPSTTNPSKAESLRILKTKPTDDRVKAHVVQILAETGSLEYTKSVLEGLYERAQGLLAGIPVRNTAVEGVLEKLRISIRDI